MNRCSFCEWIPIVPGRVWPLAGHARLGQNTVVGSMAILLSWLCWGACQEEVCLDPHFLCNLTPPRLNVELPEYEGAQKTLVNLAVRSGAIFGRKSTRKLISKINIRLLVHSQVFLL